MAVGWSDLGGRLTHGAYRAEDVSPEMLILPLGPLVISDVFNLYGSKERRDPPGRPQPS